MPKFRKGDVILIEATVTGVDGEDGYEIRITGDNEDEHVDVAAGIEQHATLKSVTGSSLG
jgi:hypothetical protein